MITTRIRTLLMSGVATACVLAVAGGASAASYGGAPIKSPYANYDSALQLRYEALANMEAGEDDSTDEWAYWNKAVDARDGYLVLPDDPANRDLKPEDMAFAQQVYSHLLKAYRAGVPGSAAAELADAQVNFDCWMNDMEEGTNLRRAEICKARVAETLARISGPESGAAPVASSGERRVAAASDAAAPVTKAVPVLPVSHRLLFDFDSAELDADARAELDEVVRQAAAYPQADILVTGHTDRAGDATYNRMLAEKRAANVAEALRLRGINLARIDEIPAGESDPAIATPDGVAEPQNRRVEIMIDDR
ncbi:MAG: OmpA family protein [Minwuia sp.]|nr:OmpA family protein [Minwuia sp.]